ncbi:hypothetical protein CGCF415_v009781 [Colletotrichum fructicola]|nr:hypothetical protein CGCFRS4_v013670 [Colletotrichum fructicola]KAF4901222.1 hypothetical protein CGCF415_v009781 [Colletotrichum fructicola]KAF4922657.1 hypothetical protein CGCF245_v015251 [Colletotrichum fructicola]
MSNERNSSSPAPTRRSPQLSPATLRRSQGNPGSAEIDASEDETSTEDVDQSREYRPVATKSEPPCPEDINRPRNNNLGPPTILTDVAVVIFPVAVIVFVIMLWRLDGARVGDKLGAWQNAVIILATLFPILFASIIGRLMFQVARWKLEKGASLVTLEQLIGSRTVGSTLLTIFQFRTTNALAGVLLVVWVFSPLGAQAFLRALDSKHQAEYQPANVTYLDNLGPSSFYGNSWPNAPGDSLYRIRFGSLATKYVLLVTAPKATKIDRVDLWGNVRIPFLDPKATAWQNVSTNPDEVQYSSLVGIPVAYPGTGNVSFTMESSYINLELQETRRFLVQTSDSGDAANITSNLFSKTPIPNGTWHGYPPDRGDRGPLYQWAIAVDRFIDDVWDEGLENESPSSQMRSRSVLGSPSMFTNETDIIVRPSRILLQLLLPLTGIRRSNILDVVFRVSQKYVESQVDCWHSSGRQKCKVVAQRPSKIPHAPEQISELSFPSVAKLLSNQMPAASAREVGGFVDPSIYYLKDPNFEKVDSKTEVDIEDLDPLVLSVRFGQLLNTYAALGHVPDSPTNISSLEPNTTTIQDSSTFSEVFVISEPWIIICLFSSLVLLVGGILSIVFVHLTCGPEILGYVSTTVRSSRFIELDPKTVWLDSSDLSNEMKAMRIQYGFTMDGSVAGERAVAIGRQENQRPFKSPATVE